MMSLYSVPRLAALVLLLAPAGAFAQEFSPETVMQRLMEADVNHDGVVTRAEFVAWRAAQFSHLDRNGDGYLTRDDLPALFASQWDGPRFTQLREAFDADHDGRISRAEFVSGPTIAFDMADTNHDGIVTRAELQAAIARATAQRTAAR